MAFPFVRMAYLQVRIIFPIVRMANLFIRIAIPFFRMVVPTHPAVNTRPFIKRIQAHWHGHRSTYILPS